MQTQGGGKRAWQGIVRVKNQKERYIYTHRVKNGEKNINHRTRLANNNENKLEGSCLLIINIYSRSEVEECMGGVQTTGNSCQYVMRSWREGNICFQANNSDMTGTITEKIVFYF